MNIIQLLSIRYLFIAYGSIVVFTLFPLGIVLFAGVLASLSGCPDGEYSNLDCTNGDILYALSRAHWLLVFTIPVGLVMLGAVILANVVLYLLIKKRALVLAYIFQRIRKKFFR